MNEQTNHVADPAGALWLQACPSWAGSAVPGSVRDSPLMAINPLAILGILALVAGAVLVRWYAKTKRPMIVLTAGMLFFFAFVAFWRSCSPAHEHSQPRIKSNP